ncbi:MAG: hypothetical protein H0Z40_02270 [Desulfotomaculum sp.]|nr:hypothetical protein [Desulfotomaculum sp.]
MLINKNGEVQGVFRKVHAYATERYYFTDVNKYPVFETEFGNMAQCAISRESNKYKNCGVKTCSSCIYRNGP